MRVHVLDAIIAGAEAPERVSELRGERWVDPGELGGQFDGQVAAALAREQERGAEAARRKRISAGEVCGAGIGCDCESTGPDFDEDGCGT